MRYATILGPGLEVREQPSESRVLDAIQRCGFAYFLHETNRLAMGPERRSHGDPWLETGGRIPPVPVGRV